MTFFLSYLHFNYCAFQQHTDCKIQSSTDKCVFRYSTRQSNVKRLLQASDYCQALGNQIVEHSSDNETVQGSSRKLVGAAAEHLIDRSKKCICRLIFKFYSLCVVERRSKRLNLTRYPNDTKEIPLMPFRTCFMKKKSNLFKLSQGNGSISVSIGSRKLN